MRRAEKVKSDSEMFGNVFRKSLYRTRSYGFSRNIYDNSLVGGGGSISLLTLFCVGNLNTLILCASHCYTIEKVGKQDLRT